jgi:hypothetical protein
MFELSTSEHEHPWQTARIEPVAMLVMHPLLPIVTEMLYDV